MNEREQFEDMLMDYFSLGFAEGKEGRDHDDMNGSAQEKFHEIMRAWQAARATVPEGMVAVPVNVMKSVLWGVEIEISHLSAVEACAEPWLKSSDLDDIRSSLMRMRGIKEMLAAYASLKDAS